MVTTYSISQYGSMIADRIRVDAYAKALKQCVRPDSVVLDIGTGTGIFALLACRYGARRVYAVDPSDSIELARQIAVRNGMDDRIVFIQDLSTQITLPEPVDAIVSNITGVLPFFELHIPSIADARRRFLKPGGVLIPREDRLFAALAEIPDPYCRLMTPWSEDSHGLDLSLGRQVVANTWIKQRVKPENLLSDAARCATIDYTAVEATGFCTRLNWTASRHGVAHAVSLWFDSTTAPGVELSNAPHAPELIFGAACFPLEEPVPLKPGDRISLALRADLIGSDYVWSWETLVTDGCSTDLAPIARFQQSSFFAEATSPTQMRKRGADYRPDRNTEGEVELAVLSSMDGLMSLQEIAGRLLSQFPGRFRSEREALVFAGEMSQRLSR
jgi:protein arginine N-methyltransferase 1